MTKSKSKVQYLPTRQGEPEEAISFGDISKAKKLLNYTAQTDFQTGLSQTIHYYESNSKI